jgi:hypothetical protein
MAARTFDPFEVLGVAPGATKDEVRAAYRNLVVRYHPDKHRGNPLEELAAAKLVEINRAYAMLSAEPQEVERGRPPAEPQPVERARPTPVQSLLRSVGWLVGLVFFLRFGLALGRQALMLLRAIALGVLSIVRLGPIFAIAVVLVIVMSAGYFLRSRRGQG